MATGDKFGSRVTGDGTGDLSEMLRDANQKYRSRMMSGVEETLRRVQERHEREREVSQRLGKSPAEQALLLDFQGLEKLLAEDSELVALFAEEDERKQDSRRGRYISELRPVDFGEDLPVREVDGLHVVRLSDVQDSTTTPLPETPTFEVALARYDTLFAQVERGDASARPQLQTWAEWCRRLQPADYGLTFPVPAG